MTILTSTPSPKPWYREPWLWFVLAPLIVVVLVSMVTVTIAIYSADDVVSDNYYKEGRMLEQPAAADGYAQSIGLRGTLTFDNITGEVFLDLNQDVDVSRMRLLVSHPAEAARDKSLLLEALGRNRYRADIPSALSGRWYVRVTAYADAEKEAWRLHGETDFSESHTATLE